MIICVLSCAVLQVSAEDTGNITLTSDEVSVEDVSSDTLQTSENGDGPVGMVEENDAEGPLTGDYKSFADIRQSIEFANPGSTIYLAGAYFGDGSPISISKRITIEGTGDDTYLDAGDNSRIFEISASQVTLKNLKLEGGFASYYGGAIYFTGGSHTIDNCYFEDNQADCGGAIYNDGAKLSISNTKFSDNGADDDGGAIYNDGSSISLNNCTFEYNGAGDEGGAIYDNDDSLTARNCHFVLNTAKYYGGAMCYGTAYDSKFEQNIAYSTGGGMYYGSEFDCSFSGNSPQNVYGTDCYESITASIQLSKSGGYYGGTTVSAKVINTKRNSVISGVPVTFKFSNGKSATVYTGSNGVATYNVPFNPGTYSVTATIPSAYSASAVSMGNIRIAKASATISPTKLSTKYGTCKSFKVKVVNSKTKKGIGGVKLLLKVYSGKKAKKVYVTTDSSGNAYYSPSKLKVGKHKVKVSIASNTVSGKAKTSKITVKKASIGLNTYDGIWYYKDVKKGKYYIGVYNKNSGQYLKGIKLKVKVYTGKKSKTYTVKTKKDGYAILKTKGIKVGKHKVKITFKGNKNFKKASAKATIEVTKKIPTRTGYYYMFTSYSYWGYGSRSVKAFVKDIHGNDLTNKKITIYGSLGGTTTGYSGDMISLPSGSTVVMKFAGDKKYMPSTFTIHFV